MPEPTWATALERFAAETMSEHGIPGLSLALAQDGVPLYARGFGHRDREAGRPAGPDTRYGIASCTKSFTAAAVMQLQEAGRLCVHDPVVRFLPEFRTPDAEATRRITLHHLLTHTSGLPPLPSRRLALARSRAADPDAEADPVRDGHAPLDTFADLLAYLAETPFAPLGPPGALFSYSNDAFALLGAVVERAAGQPYTRYVAERILAPAGMAHTTFSVEAVAGSPEATVLYASRTGPSGREVFRSPVWEAGAVWDPPGGLKSTVTDLVRYLDIYRTGGRVEGVRILAEESVRAMTHQHVLLAIAGHPPLPAGAGYGYGLSVRRRPDGVLLVGHGGGRKGVSAHVLVAPERGVSGAVLSNLAGVPAAAVLEGAIDGQLGLTVGAVPEAPAPVGVIRERLEACVGTYVSGEGGRVAAAVEDGALMLAMQGERLPAHPVGPDVFAVREGRQRGFVRFLFAPGGRGPARAMTLGSRIVPRAPAEGGA